MTPGAQPKTLRCESCGATLSPDKSNCDYCGSHHNLPVWKAEPSIETPVATRVLSPRRILVLLAVALLGALSAWLITR
ncbi:MAG: hypothetical protein AAGF31_04265 [Planctomycetota bacterium]